jgi:hypothetical protein
METQTHYVSTLLGRVFLITNKKAIEEWGGVEDEDGKSDYDSIIDHVEAEEAGLESFSKGTDLVYLTFFSMSSKIEIFRSSKGIVLFEGLFFNETWDYTKRIIIEDIEETPKRIVIDEQLMVVINAAADGRNLSLVSSENNDEYCAVQLENGEYKVTKVQVRAESDNNYLERMGIELCKI